jgi:hypothetical protein
MRNVSIDVVKRIHESSGGHFFSSSNIRFFRSRISSEAIEHGNRYYFVTSEQFSNVLSHYKGERLYTARYIDTATGEVDNLSKFQEYTTSAGAWQRIKNHIATIS